jgi:acyl carrier protein
MDGIRAARTTLLAMGFIACASGLSGCLKTETPVVTEQTADHPFKRHLLVWTYKNAASSPKGYGLIDLHGAKYRWTPLVGEPVFWRPDVYLRASASGGYILVEGSYIGFLRRDANGFWYAYSELGSADCKRLEQSEFDRLQLQTKSDDCIAPTFNSLVGFLEKIDWTHRAPSLVFKIIRESDESVIDREPALAEIKNRCAAIISEGKVKHIIAEHLGLPLDAIKSQSRWSDLHADAMDRVELTMAFEEAFDLEIEDDDAERIETVQNAVDVIRESCFRSLVHNEAPRLW